MFSVFEEITRIVVKEMDAGGDMIAVRSLVDADRFHCFHLVGEKRTFFGYGGKRLDELDSGLQGQKAEFQILDNVDSKGKLIVELPKKITISGSFQGSHDQKIEISENQISQQYLDTLENREGWCFILFSKVFGFGGFQKHEGVVGEHGKCPPGTDGGQEERCAKLPL
uniref:Gasdermin pore forming domain-containing protein n=1 Tax=Piliocolobus tephrosceles TaxID=591936 RepID=A0A8C9LN59_9PRIM